MKKSPTNASKTAAQNLVLRQIKAYISTSYIPSIDQIDLKRHQPAERDRTLLSRGLAAMAAHNLANIELSEASRLVVDQPSDNGIDAVAFDPSSRTLYLIQAKYYEDGNGGIATDAVLKLIKGFTELSDDDMTNFGSKMQRLRDEVQSIMGSPGVKFILVLVYTGSDDPRPEQISSLDRIKRDFNSSLNPNASLLLDWNI